MLRGRIAVHPIAVVLTFATIALAAGCGSSYYPEVSVSAPELSGRGPALSVAQWRRGVGEVCRRAAVAVGGASKQLSREINAGDEVSGDGEISRRAFDLARPVFEQQLRALARRRPPAALADAYQGFIDSLADELLWTGRIAQMLGTDASDDALHEADQGLADSAAAASRFVRQNQLRGCMLVADNAR